MNSQQKLSKTSKKNREEHFDQRNHEGYFDLTAFLALERIIDQNRRQPRPVPTRQSK